MKMKRKIQIKTKIGQAHVGELGLLIRVSPSSMAEVSTLTIREISFTNSLPTIRAGERLDSINERIFVNRGEGERLSNHEIS
jgi:hypothetical protein